MLESLQESLTSVFRKLSGKGRLSEKNIQEGLREVRMALLQADVNFKVTKAFIKRVTDKAVGTEVVKNVNPAQQIIKIVHDELVDLMGPVDHTLPPARSGPAVIMMVGLQGSGKTTTSGKLALYARKKGRKPMLVAADMIRPAAVQQLVTLGQQIDIPVHAEKSGRPVRICKRAVESADEKGIDLVILDTQGRLHIDEEMMEELTDIKKKVKPHQIFLVTDAMTGQDAVQSAGDFHQKLGIDGLVMTKLDGDARGGAALSVKEVTGCPIRFIGVGEKMENLEEFHPDRLASRILGMGDVVSLVERAQEAVDQDEAKRLQEKIQKNELTLDDFLKQMQQVKKMGPIKQILKMLPGGLGEMAQDVNEDEMKYSEAILQSMTPEERKFPEILNGSRKKRVSHGCGRPVHEVNSLLKQFQQARKMLKMMKKGKGGMGGMFPGMGG